MICNNCGKKLKDGAVFCSECGSPVNSGSSSSNMNNNQTNYYDGSKKPKKSKKALVIVIIAAVAVAVVGVVLFFLISNLNATKELKAAVDAKDLYLVDTVYSEAYGNESKLKKYDEVIGEMLNDIKTDIESQNFDESAKDKGDEAVVDYIYGQWGSTFDDQYTPGYISVSNEEAWNNLIDSLHSKASYCDGIYYVEQGEYLLAIPSFFDVIESDSSYDNAQTKAFECIDTYLSNAVDACYELVTSGDKQTAIDEYNTAMNAVDIYADRSEEALAKIWDIFSSCSERYVAKADEAFKKHNVEEAVNCMFIATAVVEDNEDNNKKYSYYQEFIPLELYIEDNVLNEEANDDFWGSIKYNYKIDANDNEKKEHSLVWYNNNNVMASMGINYDLSGKYDTLTGEIFLSQYYSDTDAIGYFEAYGDGELIYTSTKMTSGIQPEDVSFSVSGVNTLQLKFYGISGSGYWNTSSEFGVNNMIVQKNFPE